MSLRFGTDGVRGRANAALSPEFVIALGRAAARTFDDGVCAIGRDTRVSGSMLAAALAVGLTAEGVDVVDLGVIPTPGIAHWAQQHGQPGAVISASHNHFADNGVKFFAAGGRKLTDAQQLEIEDHLDRLLDEPAGSIQADPVTGQDVGTLRVDRDGRRDYVEHLVHDLLGGRRLDGMSIVVDAANGAASPIVAEVFGALDATVTVLAASPDGVNINDRCGSTHPEALQAAVVARRARLGLALDGDADRLLAVDEQGNLIDGDALLAMFALDLASRRKLAGDKIVATVMSNLGLEHALAGHGIGLVRCPVGDRNVLTGLEADGLSLGGEQSGHLIFPDHATTGDGLLAGVLLADLVLRSSRPVSELASVVTPVPQVLVNVTLERPVPDLVDRVSGALEAARARLEDQGRVLIRLSGTEPLARVMVEATDATLADEVASMLADEVTRVAGA